MVLINNSQEEELLDHQPQTPAGPSTASASSNSSDHFFSNRHRHKWSTSSLSHMSTSRGVQPASDSSSSDPQRCFCSTADCSPVWTDLTGTELMHRAPFTVHLHGSGVRKEGGTRSGRTVSMADVSFNHFIHHGHFILSLPTYIVLRSSQDLLTVR